MRQITARASSAVTTIEVDGALNAVSVYDLHFILDTAVRGGAHRVDLDLTRVTAIDDDGMRGLSRFCQAAIADGTTLSFAGASRAATEAMRGHRARLAKR